MSVGDFNLKNATPARGKLWHMYQEEGRAQALDQVVSIEELAQIYG